MATPQDNEILCQALTNVLRESLLDNTLIETILLVGIREPLQIELIKTTLRSLGRDRLADRIETCDIDEGLNPTIIHDLEEVDPIPAVYDLVICANTLMYINYTDTALQNLHHISRKYLILLEPIYRVRDHNTERRTDNIACYYDVTRFFSKDLLEKIKIENPKFELQASKVNFEILENQNTSSWVYNNPTPDKLGGLWIFKE